MIPAGGFVLASSFFWLMYVDLKDSLRPEPRHMLLLAFGLGCVANVLGVVFYRILNELGVSFPIGASSTAVAMYCLLVIGPLEEGVKFAVTRWGVFRSHHFDERIDGLVYPSCVAIGFAAIESLTQAIHLTPWEHAARAAVGPPLHSVFAMIWGFGVAHAWFRATTTIGRILWQVIPLAAAMLLHGLYDFALLGLDSTFLASAILAVLWIAMLFVARHLVFAEIAKRQD
jgi:RsiW-degrading membrane proteinase PrsW (M82 family)